MEKIPFNKPFFSGTELLYIRQAVLKGKISGDGFFTHECHRFFKETFGLKKPLLTTSCTDALEMSALLMNISEKDEVIIPSFTFPSTATAFALRGAKIVFADSSSTNPNIDLDQIKSLITKRTKAIVPVHYAGVACDMEEICSIAAEYNCFVVEDAAQAIDSYYKKMPLGSIGHFGTFSFHETKNISSGEGGLLSVNDERFFLRAEIIREKGTNRAAFFRGEVDKYGWVDLGSSFLPSDITAAFLYAQLENLESIQKKRIDLWNLYYNALQPLANSGYIALPELPVYATNNAHLFYIICRSLEERHALIDFLKTSGIMTVFHYQSLHKSSFYKDKHDGRNLPNSDRYSQCLLRLPLYYDLTGKQVEKIADLIKDFYGRFYDSRCKQLSSCELVI